MKRERGFYWIKKYDGWDWETSYWDGRRFYLCQDMFMYTGESFFAIHETPIPCPSA